MLFMDNVVIAAPHPDDKIIGCYEVLTNSINPVIIYSDETDADRREKVLKLKEHVDCKLQLFQMSIPQTFMNKINVFYFPDPIYETHPLHRQWGIMGETMARNGFNVIFYSTNMACPYIHEVKFPDKKEELLNKVYPDQKTLWQYEKKYILFEGYNKWLF